APFPYCVITNPVAGFLNPEIPSRRPVFRAALDFSSCSTERTKRARQIEQKQTASEVNTPRRWRSLVEIPTGFCLRRILPENAACPAFVDSAAGMFREVTTGRRTWRRHNIPRI